MLFSSNTEIDPSAKIGEEVRIGPFSTIGPRVKIGDRTKIGPNVHIEEGTVVGADCRIFHGASIGGDPQIAGVRDIISSVQIGDKTTIREFVTIHRSAKENKKTTIGKGCLLMAYAHVAHDCVIGDDVVLVNATSLSGHIVVEDRAFISGMIGAHQFVRFGKFSMTGGMSRIVKDVLPFSTVEGNPARLVGTNAIGLKRAGIGPSVRSALKKSISLIMHDKLNTTQAIKKIEEEIEMSDEIRYLVNFVNQSDRGIIR